MVPVFLSMIAAVAGAVGPVPDAPRTGTVVVETLLGESPDPPPPPPGAWIVAEPAEPVRLTNQGSVFTEANYPFWADRDALEGVVSFRVAVDATGRALGCEVTNPSNVPEIDRPTCDLVMGQGRFAPARDRKGRPIAGILRRTIHWRLEDREPFAVADESVRTIITVDAEGHRQCRIEASPGADVDPRTCQAFLIDPAVIVTVSSILATRAGERDRWELVYHQGTLVPGGPAGDGEKIGAGPGEQLLNRGGVRLTIDAAGKVTGCTLLDTSPDAMTMRETICAPYRVTPYVPGLIVMDAT